MTDSEMHQRRQMRRMDADELASHQLQRLNSLFKQILPHNRFYGEKLRNFTLPLESLEQLSELPFTYKNELSNPVHGDHWAANLTYPIERYVRFHRTSGTHGRPLVVVDTLDDWKWWTDTWQYVLDAAEIGPEDRVLMAFSFGPFIGFWSANDALVQRRSLVIPSGGLSTLARLEMARAHRVTSLFCTPTYALHMAEVAVENQIDVASLDVRRIVVAGEPGGSVPAIRERIEKAWNAKLIDHSGASEVGPWGFADSAGRGLYVIESDFIAEFLSVETGESAGEGELAELVITTLGRSGCPVIRYRTGDLVRPTWNSEDDCSFVLLDGGVLGRVDDMMIIRGVNIFPSSVEQILRSFPEIIEYRMTAYKSGEMDAISVEVEDRLNDPHRVAKELKLRLGLNVDVTAVDFGSLPRFEGKGKRFIDQR